MLVCGTFDTELDFRSSSSMRKSLVAANLIGNMTDVESLGAYSRQLVLRMKKTSFPGNQ
jgi:hypothetical protein